MATKRKSHNLDETLLRRAKRALGVETETAAIHAALRAVLVGQQALSDLESVRSRRMFRPDFVRDVSRGTLSR